MRSALIALLFAICAMPLPAAIAATVTLAWDANPEQDLDGYKVHYGTTSQNYQHSVDVGNITSCAISGLQTGVLYYFAASAYDSQNNESEYSQEIVYAIPALDSDGDGIIDHEEINTYGTDPDNTDTDGDGIHDGEELEFWGTDWDGDADEDGIINILDTDSDNDDYSDGFELNAGFDPADKSSVPPIDIHLEVGKLQLNDNWLQVGFDNAFDDPVVISNSLSLNDKDPAVIRIRNITGNGFEIRIQEWDYLDDRHETETVFYMVMERGVHSLPDGTMIEADRFETNRAKKYESVVFVQSFEEIPVVFTSIASFNGSNPVIGQLLRIKRNKFQYRLREQEQNVQKHQTETVHYIAWEPSIGNLGDITFEVDTTGKKVSQRLRTIKFNQTYASPPIVITDMQTTEANNPANVRWKKNSTTSVRVQIDEEQSKNEETRHIKESVGYGVFSR